MEKPSVGFLSEFRLSPNSLIAILLVWGGLIVAFANPRASASGQLMLLLFGLAVQGGAVLAWQLIRRNIALGRWMITGVLMGAVLLSAWGWGSPELLALLVIPTGAAVAMIRPRAGLTAAAVGSALLLFAAPALGLPQQAVTTALIANIAAAGILLVVFSPVEQISSWTWSYYEQAQRLITETQEQKVELEQVLKELVHANEQMVRLNLLAQGLRQTAEDARAAKEQFVANVSHELRTPLNMILGFSENILQAPDAYSESLPPTLLADLTVIHRNAQHLSSLINDVLDLSQIESNQVALAREWVAVEEVVDDAIVAVQPLYQSKGLTLEAEVQEELPKLFIDRTRIREVLLNLLSNAGRFTEQGGVRVKVRDDPGLGIVFSVADTGPGIAEENIPRLFQPFQQLDGSIRRRFGGTGLGLSISKRFVELHDGKIWIESKLNEGTTFFFRLPYQPYAAPAPAGRSSRWLAPEWEYVQKTRPSRAPKPVIVPRIIVLDSEGALTRMVARYLSGVEVAGAASLEEVERLYQQSPAHALVVNDPSFDGAMERINTLSSLADGLPVFLCLLASTQEEWRARGVAGILTKPISREKLLQTLDQQGITGGTVLIVDDEPDALQLFGRILNSTGRDFSILLARNGQEAMEAIADRRPDAILLDLMMPVMNGFQFLERCAAEGRLAGIPVILISAQDLSGQPVVSSAMAVTKRSGLSIHEVLKVLETTSRVLSIGWPKGDPTPPGDSVG